MNYNNICPKCKSSNVRFRPNRQNWICDDCDYIFTISDDKEKDTCQKNNTQSKGRIFISYGHDCKSIVNRIMLDLVDKGYEVWVDAFRIKSGDNWRNAISNGILNSQVVLSFLSKYSLREGGVCLNELAIAVGCNRNAIKTCLMEKDAITLIPSTINGIEYIDMTSWNHLDGNAFEEWYKGVFDELCHNVESTILMRQDPILKELEIRLRPSVIFDNRFYELRRGFTSRKWLSNQVTSWINNPDDRMLLLTAYPGGGKSAFCAHYFHLHPYIACLSMCEQSMEGIDETPQILKNIAYQLSQTSITYRNNLLWTLNNTYNNIDTCELINLFNILICIPFQLEIDGNHPPMIIVIDGVDFLDNEERNNLIELFSNNINKIPSFVRVLFSSRHSGCIINNLVNTVRIDIDPTSTNTVNDIKRYLRKEFPAESRQKIKKIAERCKGSFLYATLLSSAIKNRMISLDDEICLLPQIEQLYYHAMIKLFPKSDDFKPYWRPFAFLVALGGEIPLELLRVYMEWLPYEINRFCTKIMIFLQRWIDISGTHWIRIVYPSFITWITTQSNSNIFYVPLENASKELADVLWQRFLDMEDLTDYELVNIRSILLEAKQHERLCTILQNKELMFKTIERIKCLQEDPHRNVLLCQLTELCKDIANHICDDDAKHILKGELPFLELQRNFVSGNYWKVIDYYEANIEEMKEFVTPIQFLHILYMMATSFDLIGKRQQSIDNFIQLYQEATKSSNQKYKFYALVGMLWNDHFSNINEGKFYIKQLNEIATVFLEEKDIIMRTLIVARFKLSTGLIEDAFSDYYRIVENNSLSLWGYNSISSKLQMLLIESLVAAYDNNKYLKGIEIGRQIYSRIGQTISVSSCYCLSWLIMNHIQCGNYSEAETLLLEAELKNDQLQKIGPSKWISMHLKSVRSYLYNNTGFVDEAIKLIREVIILAQETNDWWVLGDAYFDLFCISKLNDVDLLFNETFDNLYKQLKSVADISGLPHLLLKANVMNYMIVPSKDRATRFYREVNHYLIKESLPSTNSLPILYFCYLSYREFFPKSKETKYLYDTIVHKANLIDKINPGIEFTRRNKIIKLLKVS